ELKITVVPPFYKTFVFRVAVGIVFILIVMLVYKIRMHRLKQQKAYLELQVKRRTAELQSANVELQEQKEEILSQNEEIQQQTEEIIAQRDALEEQNQEITEQKEKLAKSYGRLELLSNFGKKITSSLDIDSINRIMYEFVYSEIEINAFGIGLFIPDREEIIFPSFIEGKGEPKILRKSLSDKNSLVNWSFNNQKPLFINDIENEYTQYVKTLNLPNTSELAQSRIHIPLTVTEKKIGIFVINSFNKNAYSINDFESLQTLASYISIALDNANAYEVIKNINFAFSESINYAKSIQSAFLPTSEQLHHYVNSFLIYKPKDIVSGDFYWFHPVMDDEEKPLKAFIAVVDCTGHGVPGALISSIGNNLLKESIVIRGNHDPEKVLTEVNTHFQEALKQEKTRNNDGMDMALVLIEEVDGKSGQPGTRNLSTEQAGLKPGTQKYKISFSGAKNPLVIYRTQTAELEFIKGSRKSIGGLRSRKSRHLFEKVELQLQTDDIIYLFTDGIIDQHSPTRERYTRERLMLLLKQVASFDLEKQKEIIEREISMHMQKEKQTDDITFMGIRL
ncbi:MAG: SpoIIE family protein phosphatase, partial [Bacteroidales bacterium]|nr:SpoIIE family protein phosphatase [Bacteroidales bacterium]